MAVLTASFIAACGTSSGPSAPATTPLPSAAVASPSATATAHHVFDTATIPAKFALPMTIDVPTGWRALTDVPGVLTLVHVGSPPENQSKWWGPDIALVDGAQVVDPGRILQPAAKGDKRLPWPADFVSYLTSVPGARIVSGPEPITIGGASGFSLVLDTPPMHPVVWLKGDTAWLGGGPSGLDPALRRLVILLDVGQKHVLVQEADDPAAFAGRQAAIETLIATMRFGPD